MSGGRGGSITLGHRGGTRGVTHLPIGKVIFWHAMIFHVLRQTHTISYPHVIHEELASDNVHYVSISLKRAMILGSIFFDALRNTLEADIIGA